MTGWDNEFNRKLGEGKVIVQIQLTANDSSLKVANKGAIQAIDQSIELRVCCRGSGLVYVELVTEVVDIKVDKQSALIRQESSHGAMSRD